MSLARDRTGKISRAINNCIKILKGDPILKGNICINEMTGRIMVLNELSKNKDGTLFTDTIEFRIQTYIQETYGYTNHTELSKAIKMTAEDHMYHPIKALWEGLTWDGVPRINTLLTKYLGADDNEYTHEAMHLLMQAMIHRVYSPGCKFEIMVCLVGGQGAGKSSFFRLLAMNDDWFSDDLKKLDDENACRKIQGHCVIEMSEMLATANARSIEDIKSFLSRQQDTYKVPYAVYPEDIPRQCVFVGTSNNLDFLPLDRSGNRRFAPVMVHPENVKKHILEDEEESRAYIMQAWAEAKAIYDQTEKHVLKFSKETEEFLKEYQKNFMPEDTNVGVIQAWLDTCDEIYVCSRMIYEKALGHEYEEPKKWELHEINSVMNESISGWEKISSHRFEKYGIQRAWIRSAPKKEDFLSGDEAEELPFK